MGWGVGRVPYFLLCLSLDIEKIIWNFDWAGNISTSAFTTCSNLFEMLSLNLLARGMGGWGAAENIWSREKFLDLSPASAPQHLLQHQGLNFGVR